MSVSIWAVLRKLAWRLLPVIALTACGEGDGQLSVPPISDTCDSTSIFENGACRTFAVRLDERAPTPFVENGQSVSLEVVLFKPLQGDRFPTLVFHHGSTGDGLDPALFELTFTNKSITSYFVERGWLVAFPQRRGRGLSDGSYDEGLVPGGGGYSCEQTIALLGAERALQDLQTVTDWMRDRVDVDTTRMFIGGTSRGGILSVVHTAQRPDVYIGAINFVGGWLGEGCGDDRVVNETLAIRGSAFQGGSLWLYAEHDSFYSVAYSQRLFNVFTASGGMGTFHAFRRAPSLDGHFVLNDSMLWDSPVSTFLEQR